MSQTTFLCAAEQTELLALERRLDETMGNIGAEAGDRLDYLRAKAEGYRFQAHFHPVVPDPEHEGVYRYGEPITWDCSEDVWRMGADTRAGIVEAMQHGCARLDSDDVLKTGRTAPQAVRDWTDPFMVTITAQTMVAQVVPVRITGRWSTVVDVPVPPGVEDPEAWGLEHADTSGVDFNEAEHESENVEIVRVTQEP